MTVPTTKHPAKYSQAILDSLRRQLMIEGQVVRRRDGRPLEVVDVMAGVGRIHQLAVTNRILTLGIEMEPEWAACNPGTVCADCVEWIGRPGNYERADVVATSPDYGNRFSDHHDAKDDSTRRSYTHDLGRQLTPGNTANKPWGPKYWAGHARIIRALPRLVRPGGLVLWNVSDFYKGDRLIPVVDWHRGALWAAGFVQDGRDRRIPTPRLRGVGSDSTAKRADHEVIMRFRKPGGHDAAS